VAVVPEARRRRTAIGYMSITNELSAHWTNGNFISWEEAGVMNGPHKFHFVPKLRVDVLLFCQYVW
jgi:hypothetical protein